MRVFNFFVDVFCIIALLTFGSLMMIVALRVLPMEDALIKLQDLYDSGGQRFQIGIAGLFFIITGLALTKSLVKKVRSEDEFLVFGDGGQTTLRFSAINEIVRRALKKFDAVQSCEATSSFEQQVLKINIDLTVLSSADLQALKPLIEVEIKERILKIVGYEILIDVFMNVSKIVESPLQMAS